MEFFSNLDDLDQTILEIAEMLQKANTGVFIKNFDAHKKFEIVYEAVQNSITGKNVTIEREFDGQFITMAGIIVKGKEIVILNPKMLTFALDLSDGIEVCSEIDGTVHFSISFLHMAQKVAELPE